MKIIAQNSKRKLVEEIGRYMNVQYSIYDNTGVLEVWFSDATRAMEHWDRIKDNETFSERMNRERQERAALRGIEGDTYIDDELPFM